MENWGGNTLAGSNPAFSVMNYINIVPWLMSSGIKIIIIICLAIFFNIFVQSFIKKIVLKNIKTKNKKAKKRTETLISIFVGTLRFVIAIAVLLMILPEFGVNIAALLAGVGVIGLAIGMASREIVADFLSGIFILIEDQYCIGDRIKVLNIEGEVTEITLRRTSIKDDTGLLHSICNSQIKTIAKKL